MLGQHTQIGERGGFSFKPDKLVRLLKLFQPDGKSIVDLPNFLNGSVQPCHDVNGTNAYDSVQREVITQAIVGGSVAESSAVPSGRVRFLIGAEARHSKVASATLEICMTFPPTFQTCCLVQRQTVAANEAVPLERAMYVPQLWVLQAVFPNVTLLAGENLFLRLAFIDYMMPEYGPPT